jgi:hypothetical protein
LPLKTVLNYAKKNNLALFLIMNNYYKMGLTMSQEIKIPIFSINANYYGNPKRYKYYELFKKDIGYDDYLKKMNKKWMGNYIFYEKDIIVDIKQDIFTIHNGK